MRYLLPISIFVAEIALPIISPAIAATRTVTLNELEISNGSLSVQVPPGDGLILSFSDVGQIVKGAALGDPTQIVVSGLDGELCNKDRCQSTGASVLLLRQVSGITLPAQTHSADRGTTLTLITDGKQGRKILQLRVIPSTGSSYTALVVAPSLNPLRDRSVFATNLPSLPPLPTPSQPLLTHSLPSPPIRPPTLSPSLSPSSSDLTLTPQSSPTSQPKPVVGITESLAISAVPTPSTPSPQPKQAGRKHSNTETEKRLSRDLTTSPESKSATPTPTPSSSPTPTPTSTATPTPTSTATPTPAATPTPSKSSIPATQFRGFSAQRMQLIADAAALRRGLQFAITYKQLAYGSYKYYQAQTAIGLLRDGYNRKSAASNSGLSLDLLNEWIALGQI